LSDVFLDANILVYAFSTDQRSAIALDCMIGQPATGAQALNEMVWALRRKQRFDWQELADASAFARAALSTIHAVDAADHEAALTLAPRCKMKWWDALLVATALRVGATTFISEDHQNGFVIDGRLTITNPFRT
jgi:predicted nucleic acid-binding protein